MPSNLVKIVEEAAVNVELIEGPRVGKLSSIGDDGKAYVDYTGNLLGVIPARSCVPVGPQDVGRELFLMFEMNTPSLPVILSFLQEPDTMDVFRHEINLETQKNKNIKVDGERIVFNAKQEILLQCGKGSLTIRKDGKVIIKGENLLSRASGQNKIKGGAVSIN